ncbi:unnamed protein product [Cyclocybe aegerita]|uniref:CAF17 C-terminal domain-containing protein n=1 Tax=Cyclocybe aegerita TaxID=1973307 RepID=A0A8S0WVE6_CYCAE|nr:unnamed protein product [Cyclocybe aegerita]
MPPPLWQGLVRKTPSIAPLANRGLLSITGSQSTDFLNGLLGSSVQEPVRNQFSTGRVMYDVFLYATTNGYLLEYDMAPSEAVSLSSYLKRHVLRSKVKIRSATEEYDVWAAWGSTKDHEWETKRHWHWERSGAVEPVWNGSPSWPWGTGEGIILDRRAVGMGRRLLVRKGEHPQDSSTHDIVPTEEYVLHRIIRGVPEGAADIVPMQAFPMESNLDIMGALDFRKGCYVGQELTVRTYHTGVIRKRILPVVIQKLEQGVQISHTPPLPLNLDIKPVIEKPGPRPRGSGKILSNQKGVGLALLRLEHVAGVQKGDLRFDIVDGENATNLTAVPWWPEWWPREPDTTSST